jgi:hypothetical protein
VKDPIIPNIDGYMVNAGSAAGEQEEVTRFQRVDIEGERLAG